MNQREHGGMILARRLEPVMGQVEEGVRRIGRVRIADKTVDHLAVGGEPADGHALIRGQPRILIEGQEQGPGQPRGSQQYG